MPDKLAEEMRDHLKLASAERGDPFNDSPTTRRVTFCVCAARASRGKPLAGDRCVTRACCYEPTSQRSYEHMATHYGTAILPAHKRKPKHKAKVGVGVQVVQRWVFGRLRNRVTRSPPSTKPSRNA